MKNKIQFLCLFFFSMSMRCGAQSGDLLQTPCEQVEDLIRALSEDANLAQSEPLYNEIDNRRNICGNGWCAKQGTIDVGVLKATSNAGNIYLHAIKYVKTQETKLRDSLLEAQLKLLSDNQTRYDDPRLLPRGKWTAEEVYVMELADTLKRWEKEKERLKAEGLSKGIIVFEKHKEIESSDKIPRASDLF